MIKPFIVLALTCCCSADFCALKAANLVSNPGFETGTFMDWTLSGANSSPDDNGIYYGIDSLDAHSGNYGAYFGSVGGVLNLSQILTTVPGDNYVVSFWLRETPGTIFPYTNFFSISFGTTTLASESDISNFPYTLFTYNAVASSDLTPLVFGFRDDVGYFSLDDISVSPGKVSVPEPSGFGILSIGLLGVGWWPRRAGRSRRLRLSSSRSARL